MVARGSERIVDAIEELILELPARVRGSRTKLSEQALGAVNALVDDLKLASRRGSTSSSSVSRSSSTVCACSSSAATGQLLLGVVAQDAADRPRIAEDSLL